MRQDSFSFSIIILSLKILHHTHNWTSIHFSTYTKRLCYWCSWVICFFIPAQKPNYKALKQNWLLNRIFIFSSCPVDHDKLDCYGKETNFDDWLASIMNVVSSFFLNCKLYRKTRICWIVVVSVGTLII